MKIYNLLLTLILPAVSILFLSCADQPTGPSEDDETNLVAEYTLRITHNLGTDNENSVTHKGKVTGWNSETNFRSVYLGPEDVENNLARLQFSFHPRSLVETGRNAIISAQLSTSDVRVGTPAQINGKLYVMFGESGSNGWAIITLVNDSELMREATIKMQCVSTQTCASEEILVLAAFTALDENR